jgi:hypothetical protein
MALLALALVGLDASARAASALPKELDRERFWAHLRALTAEPHRMTGTPEGARAGDYIEGQLRRLAGAGGVDVQRFTMPQEVVETCELSTDGSRTALLPLRANGMQPCVTPPEGLTGPLIYVGSRRFSVSDVLDWRGMLSALSARREAASGGPGRRLWQLLDADLRSEAGRLVESGGEPDAGFRSRFASALDQTLSAPVAAADAAAWGNFPLRDETRALLRRTAFGLNLSDTARLNRLLLEDAVPRAIARGADGKDLRGCIAVADFQDSAAFADVFRLGAAAVIFVGGERNDAATSGQGSRTPVSADLPRFHLSDRAATDFGLLVRDRATLVSRVRWERRPGRNLFLWIPGSRPASVAGRAQFTVLSAYYDSDGVVPGNAPAEEAAANCAALLETAAVLAATPPQRSTLIAFFDDHAGFLRGGRLFYAAYRRGVPERLEDPLPVRQRFVEEERRAREGTLAALRQPDLIGCSDPRKAEALQQVSAAAKSRYNACLNALGGLRLRRHGLRGAAGEALADVERQIAAAEAARRAWQTVRECLRDLRPLPAGDADADACLRAAVADTTGRLRARLAELDEQATQLDDAVRVTRRLAQADPWCHVSLRFTAGSRRWLFAPFGVVRNIRFYSALLDGMDGGGRGADALPGFAWESRRTWESASASAAAYLAWNSIEECALADAFDIPALTLATELDPALRRALPDARLSEEDLDVIRRSASAFLPLLDRIQNGGWGPIPNRVAARGGITIEDYAWKGSEVEGHRVKRFDYGDTEASAVVPGALVHIMDAALSADYTEWADANGCFPLVPVFARTAPPAPYTDWQKLQIEAAAFDGAGRIASITTVVPNGPLASVEARWHRAGAYAPRWRVGHHSILTMFEGQGGTLLGRSRLLDGPFDPEVPAKPSGFRLLQGISNAEFSRLHFRFDGRTGVGVFCAQRPLGLKVVYRAPRDPDDALLYLRAAPGNGAGAGYGPGNGLDEASQPFRLDLETAMAGDMLALNESRLDRLRRRNIVMNEAERLHGQAVRMQPALAQALAERRHGDAVTWATRIAARERRVYRPVIDNTDDMVRAVTVLLLLSVPFAFGLQSLLLPTHHVYRRIGGFALFFALSFGLLYVTHPAFAFSATPIVIILAFVIMLLSGAVIWIVGDRFGYEIKKMQGLAAAAHSRERRVVGSAGAAVSTAISIMRRRPARTALTVLTVLLLTFTILSFAAFPEDQAVRTFAGGPADDEVSRLFIRQAAWTTLRGDLRAWMAVLAGEGGGSLRVLGRYWLTRELSAAKDTEALCIPIRHAGGAGAVASAMMTVDGLEWAAHAALRDAVAADAGALARFDAGQGVFLPPALVSELGARPGDSLTVRGVPVLFLGAFDPAKWAQLRETDGSPLAPVSFSGTRTAIGAVQVSGSAGGGQDLLADLEEEVARLEPEAFEPVDPDGLILAPTALAERFGMNLKAVVVYPGGDGADVERLGEAVAVLNRDGVYVNHGGERKFFYYGDRREMAGATDAVIPLILGGLIILSTMLGSILDREKEIYTFSALGLAPRNIAMLFLVEAAIYAVIGGYGGYLLSQAAVRGLEGLAAHGLFRAPEMNYSSSTVVRTILLVMGTVLVSAAYPAVRAARRATAETRRRWRLPAAQGDVLAFDFPFTISRYDVTGIMCFIREHFAHHADRTVGDFAADRVRLGFDPQHRLASLSARIWLQPFDQGISQSFHLSARPSDIEDVCEITVKLHRLSGAPAGWRRAYRTFLSDLRTQFLLWRTLNDEVRERYLAEADAEGRRAEGMGREEAGASREAFPPAPAAGEEVTHA